MNYKEITSWESACKIHGIDPTALPEVSKLPIKFQNYLIAAYKLGIVTEAINTDKEGKIWIPNYNDKNEIKYFPWFEVEASKANPSGFGFSGSHSLYDRWRTGTHAGSRLCFDTSYKVKHAQEYFKQLYIDFHLIQD